MRFGRGHGRTAIFIHTFSGCGASQHTIPTGCGASSAWRLFLLETILPRRIQPGPVKRQIIALAKERLNQTCRQPGLLGSTSVSSTGAIPKSAITAGSFASRFTPS
jgi:hypothetical protein